MEFRPERGTYRFADTMIRCVARYLSRRHQRLLDREWHNRECYDVALYVLPRGDSLFSENMIVQEVA